MKTETRIFVLLFLALHALAAVGVWWAMPGGFPVGHPRFWANRVAPAFVLAYAIVIFIAGRRRRWRTVAALLLLSPIAWIGAAIGGLAAFPISGRWPAVIAMVAAITLVLAIRRHFATAWPDRRHLVAIAIAPLILGSILPMTQRGPGAATHPLAPVGHTSPPIAADLMLSTQRINDVTRVVPSNGTVMTDWFGMSIEVHPLLTFTSRSPDQCWTNLAPKTEREAVRRRLCKMDSSPGTLALTYLDAGYSHLEIGSNGPASVAIAAGTVLPREVYSHLNSFTEIDVSGHRRLSLIFSPAPGTPIDVTYSEYPVGKPQRSAYLGGDGVFRVVEATSGEKGPFRELASGPLSRDQSLTITLLDSGIPFARLTFNDFAAQADTQLSPTAGWGYPMNSIEFFLASEKETSVASIFMSLASTSVGRGWDSVGHAAGTYRNQMSVEYLPPR